MHPSTLLDPTFKVSPQPLAAIGPGPITFTLTPDQENALAAINNFLLSPIEQVFVLSGYSGCGKSTLVRTLLDNLPNFMKMGKLIQPNLKQFEVQLTATTNKAAENLAHITGSEAITIHSFLGLRVSTNYKTGVTTLIPKNSSLLEGYLVLIDEASYIDADLLRHIFAKLKNCKIIFVGDPAQLIAVKATGAPVFESKFAGAALTTVVRQAEGNPIVDLATMFRNTVNTGEWPQFKPDGHHIQYLQRDDFNQKILEEFNRPDWRYKDSKVLAWTNKCAIDFNNDIRSHASGDPQFVVDDYAVCNSFIAVGNKSIKTDQLVHITGISHGEERHGVAGSVFTMDHSIAAFMPNTLADRNARIKTARASNDIPLVAEIEERWVDLRAAYAQTINKSQGSTYGSVFIDLDDVSRCNQGDSIARMLYVGVSRARNHVFLTGDLVN